MHVGQHEEHDGKYHGILYKSSEEELHHLNHQTGTSFPLYCRAWNQSNYSKYGAGSGPHEEEQNHTANLDNYPRMQCLSIWRNLLVIQLKEINNDEHFHTYHSQYGGKNHVSKYTDSKYKIECKVNTSDWFNGCQFDIIVGLIAFQNIKWYINNIW